MNMEINAALVRKLIAAQFEGWAHLPIAPVIPGGWDNRTFRLGDQFSVRLPSAERYASQPAIEYEWLSRLAPLLPLSIPRPVALGAPAFGYPWQWTVNEWIDGETAVMERIADPTCFAGNLADFLAAMHCIDTTNGPAPGAHNFFRGGSLLAYDAETRNAIAELAGEFDADVAKAVWSDALESTWERPPVWVHGDMSAGNLLVVGGRLNAVIDFGGTAVGDPACDLAIAWTLLTDEARNAFRNRLSLDEATWKRGRAWTLWKALITVVAERDKESHAASEARRVLNLVLTDR